MKRNLILLAVFLSLFAKVPVAQAQPKEQTLLESIDAFNHLDSGQKDLILSGMGVPDVSGFSWANVIGIIIFSSVGFIAFIYGKKQKNAKPLVIGLVLMLYPYFIQKTIWVYTIGVALGLLLYFWRD